MCIVIYIENAYLYCSGCMLFRYISTECNIHYSTKPTSLTIVIENWLCSVGNFSQFFLSHFSWSVLYTAFMTTLLFFVFSPGVFLVYICLTWWVVCNLMWFHFRGVSVPGCLFGVCGVVLFLSAVFVRSVLLYYFCAAISLVKQR